jgi:hypothetical protein
MKKILLAMLLSPAIFAGSGVAKLGGTASVSNRPEFVTVSIMVKSQCYPTSHAARLANDEIVSRIQNKLSVFVSKNGIDGLSTSGGFTASYSKTVHPQKGDSYTVCLDTFEKQTTLTFKTTDVQGFSETLSNIQDNILPEFKSSKEVINSPISFVVMGSPEAGICQRTREEMQLQAQTEAVKAAKYKLMASAIDTGINNVRIIGISDQVEPTYNARPAAFSARENYEHSPVVELSFDDITVTQSVLVTFKFDKMKVYTDD